MNKHPLRHVVQWLRSNFGDVASRSERGDTLIEVLIALVVIGIASVALLTTFSTTVSTSAEYQKLSTTDTVLRTALEEATSQLQLQTASYWSSCTIASTTLATPALYSGKILSVQYWNGSAFITVLTPSACPANNSIALVQVQVTPSTSSAQTLSAAVTEPLAQAAPTHLGAAKLVFYQTPGTSMSGDTFSSPPQVLVEDSNGNVVTNDWSTVLLTLVPPAGVTGANLTGCNPSEFTGEVTFAGCSIDKAASGYQLTATDGTLTPITSAPFTITAGTPTQLVFTTEPGGGPSGSAWGAQPVVAIKDGAGNLVTGDGNAITLTIQSNPSGGTLSGCTATTTSGVAAFSGCQIDALGTGYTLTATDTGDGLSTTSTSFNITAGAPSKLVFTTEPVGGQHGTAWTTAPVVAIEDSAGNVVTTDTTNPITLSILANPSGGTLSGCTAGVLGPTATFTGCKIDNIGTGYTLRANDPGDGLSVTSTPFSITSGPPAKLVFTTQPGGGASNSVWSTQPVVTIEDSGNNTVTTDTKTITLAISTNPGGGTLSSCTATTTKGVATFSGCRIDNAGTGYKLTASDVGDGPPTLTATSNALNIAAGAPSMIVFTTQPGGGPPGVAWTQQPVVTIEDSAGNAVTGDTNTVTLAIANNPGGGTLSSCTSSTVNGVATFLGCKINNSGAGYTLKATDAGDGAGLTNTSNGFNVIGSPSRLVFTVEPGGGAAANVWAAQAVVTIEDAAGNTVTTDNNTISLVILNNPNGGALSGCTVTVTNGVGSFAGCKINKAGAGYSLKATDAADGNLSVNSNPFNITAVGPPSQLVFVTEPGGGAPGSPWAQQPVVAIEDASGNIVTNDGNAISLSVGTNPAGNGRLSSGCSAATVGGVATFSGCSINRTGNGYTLSASDGGDRLFGFGSNGFDIQ